MKIIFVILAVIGVISSYGCSYAGRKSIILNYRESDYYKQQGFSLLENKIFSIYLPSEIDLDNIISFNENGIKIPCNIENVKNQTFMHLKSSEKSHYKIDKFRIDNPTEIRFSNRLILRKENGIRRCFLGKGPLMYHNVFVIDNTYCIQYMGDRGFYVFTFINEEYGEVVEMFLSSRLGISDNDIETMISSIRFKDTDINRQIMIDGFGTLKELDARETIE